MATVRIDSGGLPSAVGVDGSALMRVIGKWQSIADGRFPDDCAALLQMVDETDRLRLWEKKIGGCTFKDRNEFLQRQVLIDFNLTEQSLNDIIARLRRGETLTMRAMRIGNAVKPLATKEEVKLSRAEGGKKGGRGHKNLGDNIPKVSGRGTSAVYLAAKLKRYHPEVAEQLAAGEFRSVRAAAKAAGIVHDKTPLEHLSHWWDKASDDDRTAFRAMIDK